MAPILPVRTFRTEPSDEDLEDKLSTEFGWFLALHPEKALYLNGKKVCIPNHEINSLEYMVDDIFFDIRIIRWDEKPGSEKSFTYLLNSDNKIVDKQYSKFNKKPGFYPSIYVSSTWADSFDDPEENLISNGYYSIASPVWKKLQGEIQKFTQKIYYDFLRKQAEKQIDEFESCGVFPDYKNEDPEYAGWRLGFLKSVVKEIYLADPSIFNRLSPKQSKVIVRLLGKV